MTQADSVNLLRDALIECKRVIESGANGSIVDTIWQDDYTTLVDHIDIALAATEAALLDDMDLKNLFMQIFTYPISSEINSRCWNPRPLNQESIDYFFERIEPYLNFKPQAGDISEIDKT